MIVVEDLSKRYGSAWAIQGLSFSVEKGEVVGFLGANGAGKSTTMRILAGALGATGGRALVGGLDVTVRPKDVKRMVGYLPEFPPLYVEMTVRSYLRFCAQVKGASDVTRQVEWAIERVGLKDVAHRIIEHLSKGYRQRVGIASALVHDPQVLILDEPTSGLDPAQRAEIRALVRELADGSKTVILSTHVLPEVEATCKRVIIVNKGKIVAQNTVEELQDAGRSVVVKVARPDEALADRLKLIVGVKEVERQGVDKWFVRAEVDVREKVATAAVENGLLELKSQLALEDVFLQLTGAGEQ